MVVKCELYVVGERVVLKAVLTEDSNVRIGHNGICTWVPRKSELDEIVKCVEAAETYNKLKDGITYLRKD